jgi:hypothetical protein
LLVQMLRVKHTRLLHGEGLLRPLWLWLLCLLLLQSVCRQGRWAAQLPGQRLIIPCGLLLLLLLLLLLRWPVEAAAARLLFQALVSGHLCHREGAASQRALLPLLPLIAWQQHVWLAVLLVLVLLVQCLGRAKAAPRSCSCCCWAQYGGAVVHRVHRADGLVGGAVLAHHLPVLARLHQLRRLALHRLLLHRQRLAAAAACGGAAWEQLLLLWPLRPQMRSLLQVQVLLLRGWAHAARATKGAARPKCGAKRRAAKWRSGCPSGGRRATLQAGVQVPADGAARHHGVKAAADALRHLAAVEGGRLGKAGGGKRVHGGGQCGAGRAGQRAQGRGRGPCLQRPRR